MQDWIQSRNLDEELMVKHGVTAFTKDGKEWIKIPFFKNGEIVNTKYRCTSEKAFYQDKDGEKVFYNHDVIFDETLFDQPVIITEGEIDAWTFIQSGYIRTVSVPDGAPNEQIDGDSKKYSYLKKYIPMLKKAPYVVLAVDNDKNGNNLLNDLAIRIGRGKCYYIKYPKGCKDINDALVKYGEKAVIKSFETKQPMSMDGVYLLDSLPPIPANEVYDTGAEGLSDTFKFRFGDLIVVTGIPSMGKTTFLNHVLFSLADKNKFHISFASLEQNPLQDHVRNMRSWYKGRYPMTNQNQADEWIKERFSFIYPSDEQMMNDELDLDWFLRHAEYAVEAHGANVIVLDPWNELEHVPFVGQSLTEYVGMAIRKIKRFAKIMNVTMVVVAHPTKQVKDKEGNFQMPSLYDISDSSKWYDKPELGAIVHRDENNDTLFKVAKSRYWDILGKTKLVRYKFNEDTKHFTEIL